MGAPAKKNYSVAIQHVIEHPTGKIRNFIMMRLKSVLILISFLNILNNYIFHIIGHSIYGLDTPVILSCLFCDVIKFNFHSVKMYLYLTRSSRAAKLMLSSWTRSLYLSKMLAGRALSNWPITEKKHQSIEEQSMVHPCCYVHFHYVINSFLWWS